MKNRICVDESEIQPDHHPDRWSKDLIGGADVPTVGGFSMGVAEYHAAQFGELQVHADQEEVYVVSGVGQIRIGGQIFDVKPGSTFRLAPGTPHATRRTGPAPVRVVYSHGKPAKPSTPAEPPTLTSEMSVSTHDKAEFNPPRVHDDSEGLFVVSGTGQIQVGDQLVDVRPGHAVYVAPNTPHATRRTGKDPIRTLYAHGDA